MAKVGRVYLNEGWPKNGSNLGVYWTIWSSNWRSCGKKERKCSMTIGQWARTVLATSFQLAGLVEWAHKDKVVCALRKSKKEANWALFVISQSPPNPHQREFNSIRRLQKPDLKDKRAKVAKPWGKGKDQGHGAPNTPSSHL